MTVLGLGLDVVDLPSFAAQLDDVASGFVEATFTAGELASVAVAGPRRIASLGGRFAAKEALVKAWSVARRGRPPALAQVDLREVEVVLDGWGRPALRLHGAVAASIADLVDAAGEIGAAASTASADPPGDAGPSVRCSLSISHDGPTAAAVVLLEAG